LHSEALASFEERDKLISAQWRQRIERARYETDLAERRHEEADPSALEKRRNNAMHRMVDLEAELATFQGQGMRSATAEQKQQILQPGWVLDSQWWNILS
jgi:hypothetical protein